MTSEEKQKFKDDLMSVGILHWHKGPALGGGGTAGKDKDGNAIWNDGDQLLIIIKSEPEVGTPWSEIHYVRTFCIDGFMSASDARGDEFTDFDPDEWSYWARITPQSLPAELK